MMFVLGCNPKGSAFLSLPIPAYSRLIERLNLGPILRRAPAALTSGL